MELQSRLELFSLALSFYLITERLIFRFHNKDLFPNILCSRCGCDLPLTNKRRNMYNPQEFHFILWRMFYTFFPVGWNTDVIIGV